LAHTVVRPAGHWMDEGRVDLAFFAPMRAVHFEDDELRDAAEAARVACVHAEHEAEKQSNAKVRAMWDSAARRYRELAERFERARLRRA
jgi:hypothetical protein